MTTENSANSAFGSTSERPYTLRKRVRGDPGLPIATNRRGVVFNRHLSGECRLKDTADLYTSIENGTLPSVSYVKPSGFVDGHPASSKLNLFEGFTKKIVHLVKANSTLWAETAIMITFDEGGGYWLNSVSKIEQREQN